MLFERVRDLPLSEFAAYSVGTVRRQPDLFLYRAISKYRNNKKDVSQAILERGGIALS